MYAKINGKGYPEFFTGRYIRTGGRLLINPTAEQMKQLGYKPLRSGKIPSCRENDILSISYIDSGDCIEEIFSIMEV